MIPTIVKQSIVCDFKYVGKFPFFFFHLLFYFIKYSRLHVIPHCEGNIRIQKIEKDKYKH